MKREEEKQEHFYQLRNILRRSGVLPSQFENIDIEVFDYEINHIKYNTEKRFIENQIKLLNDMGRDMIELYELILLLEDYK